MNKNMGRKEESREPKKSVFEKMYMEFFISVIGVLKIVLTAIGGGIGIWGVINLLESYGEGNGSSRSQGIKQLMAGGGIVVIAQTVVPLLANLFSTTE